METLRAKFMHNHEVYPGGSKPKAKEPASRQQEVVNLVSDGEDEGLGGSRQVPLSRDSKGPSESEKGDNMSINNSNGQVQRKITENMYLTQHGPKPLFAPAPIKMHESGSRPALSEQSVAPDEETYNIDIPDQYEVAKSVEDANKDMRDFLVGAIGAFNLDDVGSVGPTVEGFRDGVTLLPHQIQGRIWMRERETGKKSGGILADDMGLGKTIQTLTRVVEGKPSKTDLEKAKNAYMKATLVVAPVSVMPQWASEIEKLAPGLRVIQHHGPKRATNSNDFVRADVVVTTYTTLSSEHSKFVAETRASGKGESEGSSDDSVIGKSIASKTKSSARAKKAPMCALFRAGFWRIVLDEAQNIKNRSTRGAKACFDLKGKYRWVLTGTPIQNSVEELFPLFHFLKIRPFNNWDIFNTRIAKPVKAGKSANAMKRLHVVLSATMLRRTKNQTIDGKPILILPERTVEVVTCEFDPEEREFYNMLQERAATRLADMEAGGELTGKSYTQVLLLLLRLRQACNHPSLIDKDYRKDASAIESKPAQRTEEEEENKEVEELVDLFGAVDLAGGKTCAVCQVSLPKGHGNNHCNECSNTVVKIAKRKSVLTGAPGRRADEEADLLPSSAKIKKLLELLDSIHDRTKDKLDEEGRKVPPQKTIVFSQFTSMLDLIEPFLHSAGIRYCRYDGSMPPAKREEALSQIRNSKRTQVILISFKAGGTGLNLTACNNVILVDLWWNPALEDQAFDRAHRLGQKLPVSIYKLTVLDTVEQRILELQEKKKDLAMAALSGGKLAKGGLRMEELLDLFTRPDLE